MCSSDLVRSVRVELAAAGLRDSEATVSYRRRASRKRVLVGDSLRCKAAFDTLDSKACSARHRQGWQWVGCKGTRQAHSSHSACSTVASNRHKVMGLTGDSMKPRER